MRMHLSLALRVTGAAFALGAANSPDAASDLSGVWRNPQNSVHIEIASCGSTLCGNIIWADDKATADARKNGTDPLVGVNVLRGINKLGGGRWRVQVFLPEFGRTVSGTIVLTHPDAFRARTCVLAIVCKSQVWTRMD